jgi:signal transduction histidine kinase/HAMP domain-containing protein
VTPEAARRSWRDMAFAQKLAGLLILLVSVPIVVVVAFTTWTSREALVEAARSRNLERAQATAQVIDAFLLDARADVRTASALSSIVDLCAGPTDPAAYQRAMRSLQAIRTEQGLVAVYVTDRVGRVIASTDGRAPEGSVQAGRTFLSAVAGATLVDDPVLEPFDHRVTLRISSAVRSDAGEIVGTTTALIDVSAIDALTADDSNFGGAGEFGVLWTGAGLRLSHSTPPTHARFTAWSLLPQETDLVARQRLGPAYGGVASADPALTAIADRGAWLLYDPSIDPHLRIETQEWGALHATAVPLRGQRWLYGIFVPESQLFAALREQIARDWAVAFFTVLAALALSVIAAGWVSQPLRRITDAANALARGEMHQRVGLAQHDEFGQLGAAFDAMAATLAEKEQQLQAHAGELERRVEERTATLQLFERASRSLASSLELRRTAANLATLLVPPLADYCAIEIRDGHGNLKRVAARHAEDARDRRANEMPEVRPLRDPASALSATERVALDLADVRIYELSAGRQFVGYLTLGLTQARGTFAERDEQIFEELGRRAGLALANALLYQEAQDANRLKDEFLGVVSHELRTPLNAIMGWIRLVRMSSEAGIDAEKALEAVDRNARALARLVDDLLDVPRIMLGKLALDLRPIDLVVALQAAVDAIRPSAAAKGLTVHVDITEPSATIAGDAHRLQQVFGNILSNALKFTPRGGRIIVRLVRDADSYSVVVEDTGIGIKKDFLPFVFERFRQADSSTSRAHGGLGIGLSLVRQLVEMHGGRVTAVSEGPGLGSAFSVLLPVSSLEDRDVPELFPPFADTAAIDRLRGVRVLVLDDDEDSRDVAARLLSASGAVVAAIGSVPEANQVLETSAQDIDVVLADVGMPGQDGYAFVSRLRAANDARLRSLPVVAVTRGSTRTCRSRSRCRRWPTGSARRCCCARGARASQSSGTVGVSSTSRILVVSARAVNGLGTKARLGAMMLSCTIAASA